ncbi:pyridoxal-phosphate-dependent aminotransferase family protein [Candidatus Neomarinimicrobiota bacterium]
MIYPKLFIPGPTPVAEDTLASMMQPQVGHRTAEFSELWSEVTAGLEKVLGATKVYQFSNPATGCWEAAVRNTVQKRCLNLVNGAFSAKWYTVTEACGLPCDILEKKWGLAVHPEDVDEALSSGKYDVVTLVHCETSTGVLSPLEEIAKLISDKYPDVFLHVDAVSSMMGVEIKVDDWNLDTCFASLQKAWGLPAGFSVCAVSQRTLERSEQMKHKGYYLDFMAYEKFYQKEQTPATPSIPHMHGLQKVLQDIEKEGLEARFKRHREMSEITRDWVHRHGQERFAEKGYASPTLTSVRNLQDWDVQKLFEDLEGLGYRMDRGYGKLRGETFRVAHMGAVMPDDLKSFLGTFDHALTDEGEA